MGLYQGDLLLSKSGIDEAQINSKLEEFKNTLDIDNMFIAIYNTTKSAEIEAAYSENKWIFVNYNGYLCPLTIRSSATKHQFISNTGTGVLQLTCLNNEWSYDTLNYVTSDDLTSGSDIKGLSLQMSGGNLSTATTPTLIEWRVLHNSMSNTPAVGTTSATSFTLPSSTTKIFCSYNGNFSASVVPYIDIFIYANNTEIDDFSLLAMWHSVDDQFQHFTHEGIFDVPAGATIEIKYDNPKDTHTLWLEDCVILCLN